MKDEAYYLDMLNAARKIRAFTADLTWDDFCQSELHQLAVVKLLEIIGEATRRVSEQGKDAHPEIPWSQIGGMRNRLIHDYTNIDLEIVWQAAQESIPVLITHLGPLVPPPSEE